MPTSVNARDIDYWTFQSLKDFSRISPPVQNHLKKVYLLLCCTLIISGIGAYLHLLWSIGGVFTIIGWCGSSFWFFFTPENLLNKRIGLLMAASLFQGASSKKVGHLMASYIRNTTFTWMLEFTVEFNSSPVNTCAAIAMVFGFILAAATVGKRKEYLYIGGLLSTGLFVLFWLQLSSPMFGGSISVSKFGMFCGLFVFMVFMVINTSQIIEKAHFGDLDYIQHAYDMFMDFAAIYARFPLTLKKTRSVSFEYDSW